MGLHRNSVFCNGPAKQVENIHPSPYAPEPPHRAQSVGPRAPPRPKKHPEWLQNVTANALWAYQTFPNSAEVVPREASEESKSHEKNAQKIEVSTPPPTPRLPGTVPKAIQRPTGSARQRPLQPKKHQNGRTTAAKPHGKGWRVQLAPPRKPQGPHRCLGMRCPPHGTA